MLEYGSEDEPTDHRWNSAEYVAEWAATANDAPHRTAMFDAFVGELDALAAATPGGGLRILELGSGPGYLAEQICSRVPVARYTGLDVSAPMHAIAAARLSQWKALVDLIEVDYRVPGWEHVITGGHDAMVTLQAVHELRRAYLIPGLYRSALTRLRPGGVAIVADIVNVVGEEPKPHQLTTEEHLRALAEAGFLHGRCVIDLGRVAMVRAERGR
jgi:SAM-dependent methyltransferase